MAIESEKILGYLGYDPKEIDSEEKFKEKFDPDFIKRSEAIKDDKIYSAVVGKINGSLTSAIKQVAKSSGIEFEAGELKSNMPEEVMNIAFGKVQNKMKELEAKAGAGNDEKVKLWEEKYNKLESKANDYKKSLEATANELTTFKTNYETEKKQFKIESELERELAGFKWKAGASDLEKKGFIMDFKENHKLDLDEEGKFYVANAKGERIKSKNKASEFMNLNEVITNYGIEKKVYAVAGDNVGTQPRRGLFGGSTPPANDPPLTPVRKVHPNAQKNASV